MFPYDENEKTNLGYVDSLLIDLQGFCYCLYISMFIFATIPSLVFYHVLHIWLYHFAEAVQARSSDPVRWSSGRKFRERRHLQDEMAVCVYAITCVCFCEF